MDLDELFKFKLGQKVAMKVIGEPQKTMLTVLERIVQECEGGLQKTYLVRAFTRQPADYVGKDENKIWTFTDKEFRVREMELVAGE